MIVNDYHIAKIWSITLESQITLHLRFQRTFTVPLVDEIDSNRTTSNTIDLFDSCHFYEIKFGQSGEGEGSYG